MWIGFLVHLPYCTRVNHPRNQNWINNGVKVFSPKILSKFGLCRLSQSTLSLRGTFLWIGEGPIQRRSRGLIFRLKKLGQKPYVLTLSLCEL